MHVFSEPTVLHVRGVVRMHFSMMVRADLVCRMYACVRALIFGEDFTTDPVSQGLGFALRYFSGGAIALNVPLVSQVRSTKLYQP
jgi:hypothetical protein